MARSSTILVRASGIRQPCFWMSKLIRFEQLVVWQRARKLTSEIYRASSCPPLSRDFGLKDQLRRAAVSVMSNIAEGFESNSLANFIRFLRIAKASAAEIRCQLCVTGDMGLLPPSLQESLIAQAEEVSRMLGGLIKSLDRRLHATRRL